MPIKRQVSSAKATVTKSRKSPSRRSTVRRTAVGAAPLSIETGFHEATSRFISAEEKRRLILAHAEMRRPHDPVQMLSVWAGVAVTMMVLTFGYWYATKPSFVEAQMKPFDEQLNPAMETVQVFSQKMKELPQVLQKPMQKTKQDTFSPQALKQLEEEAKMRQAVLDSLTDKINNGHEAVRVDLFKP
ncbi:hypothetical protein IT408_04815 [Candidatus Uhrbacteria bacterium]|nr:hypothetical protein [Candidatus Uhrbacteria bacterium]